MGWGRRGYGYGSYGYGGYAPYVPVAKRRARAAEQAKKLEKKRGHALAPVKIEGLKIATSFWGQAWCDNLESYSDFSNRLPRGRTYVRNGSVIDLQIAAGKVTALVSGSSLYTLTVSIATLPAKAWKQIQEDCSQSISSLIDLLQGRFDRGVMQRLTRQNDGLFPKPREIRMACSCPDSAGMCKHIAAVLYGVGARLDHSPELLFTLRKVNHLDLIGQAVAAGNLDKALSDGAGPTLDANDLGEMFGIELESIGTTPAADPPTKPARASRKSAGAGAKLARPKRRPAAAAEAGKETPPPSKKGSPPTPKARRKAAPAKVAAPARKTAKK